MLRSVLRRTVRLFTDSPRFTLPTIGAFALGIGSVTGVFSLVDDALLDPLPWANAPRTVVLWERHPEMDADRVPAAPAKIMAWRGQLDVFDRVAGWRLDEMDLTGRGDPVRLAVGRVEPDLFPLLGVEPVLGRAITPDEAEPGNEGVAVLGHGFWTQRMGGDPDVLGRAVTLDGATYEIVGVLPPGAIFPEDAELLIPLVIRPYESRVSHAFRVLARLAPGVTLTEASVRLDRLAARFEDEFPRTDAGWRASAVPLREELVGDVEPLLFLLLAAGGLVFVVACANGAGLLLVRGIRRRREVAVRASLGASPSRLAMEVASEGLALSFAGGAVGLLLAGLAVSALHRVSPLDLSRPGSEGAFDVSVYLFTLGASVCAGLVFGLLPALPGTSRNPMALLRENRNAASGGRRTARRFIVTAEIALATLLLVGSGLFVRSARSLARVDPGFDVPRLVSVDVQPPRTRYPDQDALRALYTHLLDGARALPGVERAALVNYLPLGGRADTFRFLVAGRPAPASMDAQLTQIRSVSRGYFGTMGIPLLRGRDFDERDQEDSELVAVVNEAMTRRYWPDGDAIGERLSLDGEGGPWIRIVGVVADVRSAGLTEPPPPALYTPMRQQPWPSASLVVRANGDPLGLVPALRRLVAENDPLLPVATVRTGDALLRSAQIRWRFQAVLMGSFGLVALALALTGVYGLLAYVVQERTTEMAIRQAVGARASDLRALVGRDTLTLVAVGVAIGLGASAALAHVLERMLFGVSPLDPTSYAAAAVLLGVTGLLAAWIPARRAAAVQPAVLLRST